MDLENCDAIVDREPNKPILLGLETVLEDDDELLLELDDELLLELEEELLLELEEELELPPAPFTFSNSS